LLRAAVGPTRKYQSTAEESGYWGRAEKICSLRVLPPLTPFRTSVAVPTKLGWTDPRKEEGQPLWPERFTELEIRQQKKRPKAWSSQYNQNPIDIANSIFKPEMFRSYECTAKEYISRDARVNKADCWRIVTADPALSTNDRSDYTAILVADISRSGIIGLLPPPLWSPNPSPAGCGLARFQQISI
jgi:hypothetical protein